MKKPGADPDSRALSSGNDRFAMARVSCKVKDKIQMSDSNAKLQKDTNKYINVANN